MGTQLKCPNCGGYEVSNTYAESYVARKGWLHSFLDFLTIGLLTILSRFIEDARDNQTGDLIKCETCGYSWNLK